MYSYLFLVLPSKIKMDKENVSFEVCEMGRGGGGGTHVSSAGEDESSSSSSSSTGLVSECISASPPN